MDGKVDITPKSYHDLIAANAHRGTLITRRVDGYVNGVYPFWHGWAIVEAFEAGVEYGRTHKSNGEPTDTKGER